MLFSWSRPYRVNLKSIITQLFHEWNVCKLIIKNIVVALYFYKPFYFLFFPSKLLAFRILFLSNNFIYFFMSVLGLLFLCSLVVVQELLIAVASLVEHRLQQLWF